jgi:hypothetical protein
MNLQHRLDLLESLGEYMRSSEPEWIDIKEKAFATNPWFIPEFIDRAAESVANRFLKRPELERWVSGYDFNGDHQPKTVGIVMAGNIPLVGFHDFLSVFIAGHKAMIKASSKDDVLITHLTKKLVEWDKHLEDHIQYAPLLKACDAYIATGSNNSSRYFDYYFGKYPHIIRKNRTSIAVLSGKESTHQLRLLADDVFLYFGLGCRNVTKLYVPIGYDFVPLLDAFNKYLHLADHNKFRNNYDYNLAVYILNNRFYMTNGSILMIEDPAIFSPIAQLNYEYYENSQNLSQKWPDRDDIQLVVGENFVPFGQSQEPGLSDYADGEDTLNFLLRL